MDYDEFAERFLIALYVETEQYGRDFVSAKSIIEKYNLKSRPNWLGRMADEWEYSNFKNVLKTIGSREHWNFRISPEGYRKVESEFLDLNEMMQFLSSEDKEDVEFLSSISIPAADRIVQLSHNQVNEWETPIAGVIEALEQDNGDPEKPGLRERLLGEIKAGRELIRSGEFRAFLLYETLMRALGELISRYGNPTIKALANALLGAIVSQMFPSK